MIGLVTPHGRNVGSSSAFAIVAGLPVVEPTTLVVAGLQEGTTVRGIVECSTTLGPQAAVGTLGVVAVALRLGLGLGLGLGLLVDLLVVDLGDDSSRRGRLFNSNGSNRSIHVDGANNCVDDFGAFLVQQLVRASHDDLGEGGRGGEQSELGGDHGACCCGGEGETGNVQ